MQSAREFDLRISLSLRRDCIHRARFVDALGGSVVCHVMLAVDCIERCARGRPTVNGSEMIGLVLSVGLVVYLTIALLAPEWFA